MKMLGTRYGPVGNRFSILGTRIGSLKHLKKPGIIFTDADKVTLF